MAMPAGTASATESVAATVATPRLFQNECIRSECSNTARNQRSEYVPHGIESVFSGVNATRQTITSGASMKTVTQAWNAIATGPVRVMTAPTALRACPPRGRSLARGGPSRRSRPPHPLRIAAFEHGVVGQHDDEVDDQQRQRDRGAERPVQLLQV